MPAGNPALNASRSAVYERVRNLLYDDREWEPHELPSLLPKSAEANGWNAPEMDAYDDYDEELEIRWP